jgi:hypothetical protein
MRRLRLALVLLPLVTGGCIHLPCWCDDPEANPVRPGKDGRDAATLGPHGDVRYDLPSDSGQVARPRSEESHDA